MNGYHTSESVKGCFQQLPRPLESRQPEACILGNQPVVDAFDWPVALVGRMSALYPSLFHELIGAGGLEVTFMRVRLWIHEGRKNYLTLNELRDSFPCEAHRSKALAKEGEYWPCGVSDEIVQEYET